jgi:plastocyanin
MRFLFASLALGVGLLGLIPDSAQACHRRGGAVSYAPAYSGYAQPMYYPSAPGRMGYYAPGGYYQNSPQGYALQPSAPYQSFYPPTAMPSVPTPTVEVTALDDRFEPAKITIAQGSTVRWTNKGSHRHTTTAVDDAWDSGDVAPGANFTATFTQPGTFEYFCKHHKDMKGVIIVK